VDLCLFPSMVPTQFVPQHGTYTVSQQAPVPIYPLIQWIPKALIPEVKPMVNESDQSPQSSEWIRMPQVHLYSPNTSSSPGV
jgi:hypothetical protein